MTPVLRRQPALLPPGGWQQRAAAAATTSQRPTARPHPTYPPATTTTVATISTDTQPHGGARARRTTSPGADDANSYQRPQRVGVDQLSPAFVY